MASSLDLTKLLPPRYRDKTLDSLIKNLFNRHLSKEDSVPIFGFIGNTSQLQPGEVQLRERDLERQINQLTQLMVVEHGSERKIFSWPDLIQKLTLLGIDYTTIAQWFKTSSYNLVPPIDLDKFCNYHEYYWIGDWIQSSPSLPFEELGIPNLTLVNTVLLVSNPTYAPEYYVIGRGELTGTTPIAPIPTLTGWSDWALANLWVHKDDAITFLATHGGSVGFSGLVQATRPIIEYFNTIHLNTYQTVMGVPADSGTYNVPKKHSRNQPPMFDLYKHDGSHIGATSAIFYYKEGSEFEVDAELNRRVATDANADYIFEHSLVNSADELYFYKLFEDPDFNLKTIWRAGPEVAPRYVKYDTSGTLINQDKFVNFKNYYWTAVDTTPQPSYNPLGLSEYNVIEPGGTSDWSIYNSWVHVSNLRRSDLSKYVQAVRPIIEFNIGLESQLAYNKTSYGQLPQFYQYMFDDTTDTYQFVPSLAAPNLNDAYLEGKILARVADLPFTGPAIASSAEIFTQTFEFGGEQYVQGLFSGQFLPDKDGVTYGYKIGTVSQTGVGNGTAGAFSLAPTCTPEVLVLQAVSPTFFTVNGTSSLAHPILTVGVPYTVSGLTFTILPGVTPFVAGDAITIEIKSYVYERGALFVNVNGAYRTLEFPNQILTEIQQSLIVDATPSLRDGIWDVPPQIEFNVQNETRTAIGQGDLYFHFISIIAAQPDLIGSEAGKNNWRNLPNPDLGLGGKIKQYDGQAALLVSLLLQEGVTPLTLIEFARESYQKLFSSIHTFVQDRVPELLNSGAFVPPTAGDSLDQLVIDEFKTYFNNVSPVALASDSTLDDILATNFYDTTSALGNLVLTLPYLGLGNVVLPEKTLDLELNLPMLVHHDGHRSVYPVISADVLKKIVTKSFERSPGQETPGIISGFNYPALPYRGQFWFKTSTNQLFYYSAISDTGEMPADADLGAFSYDRATNTVYEFNGVWNLVGNDVVSVALPWVNVDLGLIELNLSLAMEKLLYENCPPLTGRLDVGTLEANPSFEVYLKKELEKFGVKYGTTDVYSSSYDPTNAFTWNYSGVMPIGTTFAHATWQEIYRDAYGTARPDLQPWIPSGYGTEANLLADLTIIGLIGVQTSWNVSFWNATAIYLSSQYVANGVTGRLSITTATGALIPPYAAGDSESLVIPVPATAANSFAYGDLGPVELFWTKTLDYLYSKQKSYFKLDPLTYVRETWGIMNETIGEYVLDPYFSRKDTPATFQLHGDLLPATSQLSWLDVNVTTVPAFSQDYVLTYVSREDDLFKLTGTGIATPIFFTGTYVGTYATFTLTPSIRGFFAGDVFNVNIDDLGNVASTITPTTKFTAEGFNQIYVQYSRNYGQDLEIALNLSLLRDWNIKLGYRFTGMVNTDSLSFKTDAAVIDQSAYKVYLKENKFFNSSWIDALRVQLVQRGSTIRVNGSLVPKDIPGGNPGDDWIFRVDGFNPARSLIQWYTYNPAGEKQTFIALNGKHTLHAWDRPLTVTGTAQYNAPFLITGIQNFINFIFGFSDKLYADGWRVNDAADPVLDPSTGRPLGYQLLTEQFIVQQFSGVEAGSAFVFNPFASKLWYTTPHGTVSNLTDPLGLEQETVATVLDSSRRRIPTSKLRVFRTDDLTEIVSDIPIYTLHLLTSEHEHVVLFDEYSVESTLIFDPFLGQQTSRIFVEGQKQTTFTGRIDFGGHFLVGDEMRRNVESSISNIINLYDSTSKNADLAETERARALLGFQKKDYFADRGSPDLTEFRFWQGMIANKGTNFSIDSYVNSAKYKTAKLDEYWAYKIATYGDARPVELPELKIEPADCSGQRTNYLFLEDDQVEVLKLLKGDGGFDLPDYDVTPYDVQAIYASVDYFGTELFDPNGAVIIRPDDEARWFRYIDLHAFQYFVAERLAGELVITPNSLDQIFVVNDANGNPVRADVFELVDTSFIDNSEAYDELPYDTEPFDSVMTGVYFENGDLIPGSDPPTYTDPKFVRLNHSSFKIVDPILLNRSFRVRAYAPAFRQYSPSTIFDYKNNVTVRNDVIWWDPARGVHHPEAIATVDYQCGNDPARYNVSVLNDRNANLEKYKPWGESQVGKVWWNKLHLGYQAYSDTKLYPDLQERLARWGAPADYSKVEAYEWVKSDKPPTEYDGDGIPALKRLVKRDRTWWQRTVAWRLSTNPAIDARSFSAYQPAKLQVLVTGGKGTTTLKSGSLKDAGLIKGSKFAGATYSTLAKTDAELTKVWGQATLTSDPYLTLGSANGYADGALFGGNIYATFEAELDEATLSFRSDILGQYKLENEVSVSGVDFIKMTHIPSGANQVLEVQDTPVKNQTKDVYFFDQLGIKIIYKTLYSHSQPWPGFGITTVAQRKSLMSTAIGSPIHQIYVRSTADIFNPIEFSDDGIVTYNVLSAQADAVTRGWVSWTDPTVNPVRGTRPPLNNYQPIVGEWVEVGSYLSDLSTDIINKGRDPWIWFDDVNYAPYRSTWSSWSEVCNEHRDFRFLPGVMTYDAFLATQLTYVGLSQLDVETRAHVYVNNVRESHWTVDATGPNPFISIDAAYLDPSDMVHVELIPAKTTDAELKFDPAVSDEDPFKLTQFKREIPYAFEERRGEVVGKSIKKYFFWVKDKVTPARGKSLSVKVASQLLRDHDGTYGVPQVLKYFNQVDSRPNRYGMLSITDLGHFVRAANTYKLRLTKNPTLREDDHDLSLKNVHVEWQLLRPLQSSRLPRKLWDLLTDALIGENQIDQPLPFQPLELYDERHSSFDRYGFDKTQILVDPKIAVATVKYTVLNTKVDKYVNGELIPDYISYSGFDINQLDDYLSTSTSIRQFMTDLWRFAKPKQINEIFFAVLDDAASKNLEMTDFFKTSFIALNEIRTIETPQ